MSNITLVRYAPLLGILLLSLQTPAVAQTISGTTYTYDLSEADPGSGVFTTALEDANDFLDETNSSAVTAQGILTDGNLGSLLGWDDPNPSAVFPNGTYAGFINDGFGGAPRPKIDIDLGGTYNLNSFTLHYLVEDAQFIYSPQPIDDGEGGYLFDALAVSGSADGTTFSSLGSSNDFNPLSGPTGDSGTGALEVRTATIDLTGSTASHLSVDLRTPWSFIVLSEYVVDGTLVASGSPGDFDTDSDVDGADFLAWQREFGSTYDATDLATWQANYGPPSAIAAVPEPSSCVLLSLCVLSLYGRRRQA